MYKVCVDEGNGHREKDNSVGLSSENTNMNAIRKLGGRIGVVYESYMNTNSV